MLIDGSAHCNKRGGGTETKKKEEEEEKRGWLVIFELEFGVVTGEAFVGDRGSLVSKPRYACSTYVF